MKKILLSILMLISANLYADDFIVLDMYPSANLFAMFKTGVSRLNDETYSYFANPALSSLTLTPNIISVNYGSGSLINYNALNSDNFAISLNQKKGKWSYGLGIFHQTLDMGSKPSYSQIIDNQIVITKGSKNPNHYQTGVNLSSTLGSKFKIGFGLNLKYIYIGDDNNPNPSSAIFGTDFGMIGSYNILENKKISDKMGIDLMVSAGISKTNIIFDDIKSVNSDDRMGYSIQTGFNYSFEKNDIKVLSIDWTSEAVSANDSKEFVNKISFFKDVFLLDGQSSISAYKISLMEIFSFMKGIVPEASYNTQRYTTSLKTETYGIGVSSTGILKILNEYYDNKVINWLVNNFALDYTFAKVTCDYDFNYGASNSNKIEYNYSVHNFQVTFKNLNLFGKNKKSAIKD